MPCIAWFTCFQSKQSSTQERNCDENSELVNHPKHSSGAQAPANTGKGPTTAACEYDNSDSGGNLHRTHQTKVQNGIISDFAAVSSRNAAALALQYPTCPLDRSEGDAGRVAASSLEGEAFVQESQHNALGLLGHITTPLLLTCVDAGQAGLHGEGEEGAGPYAPQIILHPSLLLGYASCPGRPRQPLSSSHTGSHSRGLSNLRQCSGLPERMEYENENKSRIPGSDRIISFTPTPSRSQLAMPTAGMHSHSATPRGLVASAGTIPNSSSMHCAPVQGCSFMASMTGARAQVGAGDGGSGGNTICQPMLMRAMQSARLSMQGVMGHGPSAARGLRATPLGATARDHPLGAAGGPDSPMPACTVHRQHLDLAISASHLNLHGVSHIGMNHGAHHSLHELSPCSARTAKGDERNFGGSFTAAAVVALVAKPCNSMPAMMLPLEAAEVAATAAAGSPAQACRNRSGLRVMTGSVTQTSKQAAWSAQSAASAAAAAAVPNESGISVEEDEQSASNGRKSDRQAFASRLMTSMPNMPMARAASSDANPQPHKNVPAGASKPKPAVPLLVLHGHDEVSASTVQGSCVPPGSWARTSVAAIPEESSPTTHTTASLKSASSSASASAGVTVNTLPHAHHRSQAGISQVPHARPAAQDGPSPFSNTIQDALFAASSTARPVCVADFQLKPLPGAATSDPGSQSTSQELSEEASMASSAAISQPATNQEAAKQVLPTSNPPTAHASAGEVDKRDSSKDRHDGKFGGSASVPGANPSIRSKAEPAIQTDADTAAVSSQAKANEPSKTDADCGVRSAVPGGRPSLLSTAVLRLMQQSGAAAGGTLLHLSPHAPASMKARAVWRLADYTREEKLYAGATSHVYRVTCTVSKQQAVLKVYNTCQLSVLQMYQVHREVEVHSRIHHPHAIQLYATFRDGHFLVLVQEYAQGGDLLRVCEKMGGRMPEWMAVELVLQPLTSVLQYLHGLGVIHRDIKPENLMFGEKFCFKLADFGAAVDGTAERPVTRTGSVGYMPPEVVACPLKRTPACNKLRTDVTYTSAVDVYAVGVLAYELLVGYKDFDQTPRAGSNFGPKQDTPQGQRAKPLAHLMGRPAGAAAAVSSSARVHPRRQLLQAIATAADTAAAEAEEIHQVPAKSAAVPGQAPRKHESTSATEAAMGSLKHGAQQAVGKPGYDAEGVCGVARAAFSPRLPVPPGLVLSTAAHAFIHACMAVQVEARPSAQQLRVLPLLAQARPQRSEVGRNRQA